MRTCKDNKIRLREKKISLEQKSASRLTVKEKKLEHSIESNFADAISREEPGLENFLEIPSFYVPASKQLKYKYIVLQCCYNIP
jgi:hypothetical protein